MDRMPVIVPPEHWDAWLSGAAGTVIVKPYPADLMRAYKVSPRVGSPENNDHAVINELSN